MENGLEFVGAMAVCARGCGPQFDVSRKFYRQQVFGRSYFENHKDADAQTMWHKLLVVRFAF